MDEWGRPRIQVAITKLFIIETKPFYHNIYKRDYTIDGSRDTLNRLGHLLHAGSFLRSQILMWLTIFQR